MIGPTHLIDQACQLATPARKGKTRQTDLRRAVSSAYYAVFHALAASSADTLIGKASRGKVAYSLLYRAFEHTPERYQRALKIASFGTGVRDFSATFVRLQKWRHLADYDPLERFDPSEVHAAIALAEDTVDNLDNLPNSERDLFLTLLLFDVRS
jgi:hypothetical protein